MAKATALDAIAAAEILPYALIAGAVAFVVYLFYESAGALGQNNEAPGQGGGGWLGNALNNTLEIGQSTQSYTGAVQSLSTNSTWSDIVALFGGTPGQS